MDFCELFEDTTISTSASYTFPLALQNQKVTSYPINEPLTHQKGIKYIYIFMKINIMFILPKWQNDHFKQRCSLLGDSITANVKFCLFACCFFTENYIPFKERTGLFSHLYWLSFKIPVWVGRSLERLQNLSMSRVIMQAKGSFQLFIEHRKKQLLSYFVSSLCCWRKRR